MDVKQTHIYMQMDETEVNAPHYTIFSRHINIKYPSHNTA